ncbi:unnamed protein product, partial [Pelagomonas calceolata]
VNNLRVRLRPRLARRLLALAGLRVRALFEGVGDVAVLGRDGRHAPEHVDAAREVEAGWSLRPPAKPRRREGRRRPRGRRPSGPRGRQVRVAPVRAHVERRRRQLRGSAAPDVAAQVVRRDQQREGRLRGDDVRNQAVDVVAAVGRVRHEHCVTRHRALRDVRVEVSVLVYYVAKSQCLEPPDHASITIVGVVDAPADGPHEGRQVLVGVDRGLGVVRRLRDLEGVARRGLRPAVRGFLLLAAFFFGFRCRGGGAVVPGALHILLLLWSMCNALQQCCVHPLACQ